MTLGSSHQHRCAGLAGAADGGHGAALRNKHKIHGYLEYYSASRRKEPAARCSATVIGWLAAASIEGGVGGVAHETMQRTPSMGDWGKPRATSWTPLRHPSPGNRTQGPARPLRPNVAHPRTMSTRTDRVTGAFIWAMPKAELKLCWPTLSATV